MKTQQKQPLEEFCKKDVLRNFGRFIGKHLCQRLFFNKVAGLFKVNKKDTRTTLFAPLWCLYCYLWKVYDFNKKETLAQVFSCEFWEISNNLRTTDSHTKTFIKPKHFLKPNSHLPKKILFVSFDESSLKMMKNAFNFNLKALLVLKIFKFFSWHFGYVEKAA